ncbi:hypothetical protein Tcan_16180 [Toxocara canis]|uniref:Uncharacterized protein n=1 Tax=Toxocara canis TaxID=6265 RepID=A0A0B2VQ58_TOXCA|nr:hypothetical protein Tcan_16180 [Toxocara canis]
MLLSLLLLLTFLLVPRTFADEIEASEVEALFSAPSSDEENSAEIEIKTTVASVLEEKDESVELETDGADEADRSANTTAGRDHSEESKEGAGKTKLAPDLTDRRFWHVPISGGDVIPEAIIPPEPADAVTEETITDAAVVALNDPRNWHVPISGGDTIPVAIVPPEQTDNSVTKSAHAAPVKQSSSSATQFVPSLLFTSLVMLTL